MKNISLTLCLLWLYSGAEEKFAFQRSVSRLMEVTGQCYHKQAEWIPISSEESL